MAALERGGLGWYMSINVERKRDVIELPINDLLDINGWDIRKALQPFKKTNPPLNEWLVSTIIYNEYGEFAERLRALAPVAYNPVAVHYHYIHMANNNFRAYLKGETVRRKKYLYVLRSLLAVNWVEKGLGVVPIEFDVLVDGTVTDSKLKSEIEELLRLKRSGTELEEGPRFHTIHTYAESELARHSEGPKSASVSKIETEILDQLFRTTVENEGPNK